MYWGVAVAGFFIFMGLCTISGSIDRLTKEIESIRLQRGRRE